MSDATATLARAAQYVEPFLTDLAALVNIDSGSYTPDGVAHVAEYLTPRLSALGLQVERVVGRAYGPQLIARRRGAGARRVLMIGHMDTVFPAGEAQRRPFTLRDGRAYGPGVLDMKSGLLVGLYALRLLAETTQPDYAELAFLLNSDEEIGSPESTAVVSEVAAGMDAALVLEPSADIERVTVTRKGVATYHLEISGVASHAGADPKRGRSAILELAHQIIALHNLNGAIPGVTVNVGVVNGGQRPNVVADAATAQIDIRARDHDGVRAIQTALRETSSRISVEGTTARLTGAFAHLPFTQSDRSKALFDLAQAEARTLKLNLRGEPSGGASDGNTTAALGIATIDGLGPCGGLAHNPGEFIDVASVAPRIALLAGLLSRIASA